MKLKISTLFIVLIISASAGFSQLPDSLYSRYEVVDHSQIKTILGNDHSHGGYLGFDMLFGEIDNSQSLEIGGRLAWVLDHRFAFGVMGSGFVSAENIDIDEEVHLDLAGGYGGLLFEPIIFPLKPIHLSVPLFCGVGGAASNPTSENFDEFDDTDAFLIFRPGLEAEVNLLKFLRLSIGGHYRFAYDFEMEGMSEDALNGLSIGVAMKIGLF